MPSLLKEWRRTRRESGYWQKARERSEVLREPEIVNEIELAVMLMGQHLSMYRRGGDRERQLDQLREVRLGLEACLGMLENILP